MEIYLGLGFLAALATLVIGWDFYTKQIAWWFAPLLFILVWVFWPLILFGVIYTIIRK